jgi:hypothetical protein
MSNPFARATVLLLVCLALAPAAAAQPLTMPADTLKAFQAFDEATELLNKAKSSMAALEASERPPGRTEDWAGVTGAYESAAEALRKAAGPAVPDPNAFGVPLDKLKSCATRAATLSFLDRQVKGAYAASQRCLETRALLKNRLDAAQKADETRRYLVKAAAKLAGAPALTQVFTGSWRDLDASLSRSIAAYASEVKRLQERMDWGNAQLRSRAAALAGYFESYGSAKDCLLAGRWIGSKSRAGTVAGLSLQLTISGTSWTGTANLDGDILPVRSVAIAGSTVSISFADGKATMKGTLSGDGRTYQGWYSKDGPGSFNLQKQ